MAAPTRGSTVILGVLAAVEAFVGIGGFVIVNINLSMRVGVLLLALATFLLGARKWTALERRLHVSGRWILTRKGGTVTIVVTFCLAVAFVAAGSDPWYRSLAHLPAHSGGPDLHLEGTLSAKSNNGTADGGTSAGGMKVAVGDSLQFELTVQNRGQAQTSPLDLEILYVRPANSSQAWHIVAAAGPSFEEELLAGADVAISPEGVDPCFGAVELDGNKFSLLDQTSHATRSLLDARGGRSNLETPFGTSEFLGAAILGSIAPQASTKIGFVVRIDTGSNSDNGVMLETGNGIVTFKRNSESSFNQVGVAAPGDQLTFDVLLHNPLCVLKSRAQDIRVRAQFSSNSDSRAVSVQVIASDGTPSASEVIGETTVSALGGGPIKLDVVPGTTQLYGPSGDSCGDQIFLKSLLDGIDEGGVDVGYIYGYTPRDPCGGQELGRWVKFVVKVSAG